MKKQIGVCGVDAGLLMVGDPCYFLDGNPSAAKKVFPTWDSFCDLDIPDETGCQLNFAKGHAGLGVVVHCTHGDGCYPVYLETTKAGCRRLIVHLD